MCTVNHQRFTMEDTGWHCNGRAYIISIHAA